MLDLRELLSERMQEIYEELIKTNGKHAVNRIQCLALLNEIDKFIMAEGDQIITENDKQNFKEYMEIELEMQGVEQEQYYLCGYLDCVSLLKELKVF